MAQDWAWDDSLPLCKFWGFDRDNHDKVPRRLGRPGRSKSNAWPSTAQWRLAFLATTSLSLPVTVPTFDGSVLRSFAVTWRRSTAGPGPRAQDCQSSSSFLLFFPLYFRLGIPTKSNHRSDSEMARFEQDVGHAADAGWTELSAGLT